MNKFNQPLKLFETVRLAEATKAPATLTCILTEIPLATDPDLESKTNDISATASKSSSAQAVLTWRALHCSA